MKWQTLVLSALIAAASVFVFLLFRSGLRDDARTPADTDGAGVEQAAGVEHAAGVKQEDNSRPKAESADPSAQAVQSAATAAADRSPGEKREPVKSQIVPLQPDLKRASSMQGILAASDPAASSLFQSGLELLDRGDFTRARRVFQEVLADYGWDANQNKLAAAAYWCIGLCYYREGGETGLSLAGTFFQSFLQTYSDCDPQELAQAAQIDLAVTYLERMALAVKEPARERAAQGAAAALKAYLEKWPGSPQAYAAGLSLARLQNYLSKP